MGSRKPGEAVGSPGQEGAEAERERPPASTPPSPGRLPTAQWPAYLTGPGSPSMQLTTWNFSRSQKRMVLQRQPGCAGKPEPWLHTAPYTYTPPLRAIKSNALGQGWPWTGRERGHGGRPTWALDLDMPFKAQDTGREPKSHLGLTVIQPTESHQACDSLGQRQMGTDRHTLRRDVRSGSHRRRALLLLLTCQSCRKPGGTRWGETPPR